MAVKDGSPGHEKLRLAFEDDDDDSSRTANRRVLFEETGRTKCDPSSSRWDGPRATKGEPWNTGRSSHDWSLGWRAPGVLMKIGAAGMALRKAAGREPKGENACALRKNDDNEDVDSHKNADDNTSMEDTSAMAKENQ